MLKSTLSHPLWTQIGNNTISLYVLQEAKNAIYIMQRYSESPPRQEICITPARYHFHTPSFKIHFNSQPLINLMEPRLSTKCSLKICTNTNLLMKSKVKSPNLFFLNLTMNRTAESIFVFQKVHHQFVATAIQRIHAFNQKLTRLYLRKLILYLFFMAGSHSLIFNNYK